MRKVIIVGLVVLISIIASISIVPSTWAHVPKKTEGNNSLETALEVNDPTKSWAIYGDIHEDGKARYYRLDLKKDQILRANLFVPDRGSFVPSLIITGPGLENEGSIPDYIEVPEGSNHVVIEGSLGVPEYEPFTPASYYYLADFEKEVEDTGTYHVIVFEPEDHGSYGLAIGKEERYGLIEWVRVPIDIIDVREWEGQSLPLIFLPMILTVIVGLVLLLWFKRDVLTRNYSILMWLATFAGLLYIGTGSMKFVEMIIAVSKASLGPSVLVTIVFASLPVLLGVFTIRKGMKMGGDVDIKERAHLAVYGVLALFLWAGFVIGPILVFMASLLPSGTSKAKGTR